MLETLLAASIPILFNELVENGTLKIGEHKNYFYRVLAEALPGEVSQSPYNF